MKNKFSERLRELRKEKGLTQGQLAAELGYSESGLGNWELGNRCPDYDTLIKIAQYFGVTTDYMLGLED